MDIHVTNKTNTSWKVVLVVKKVLQLLTEHRDSKIVFLNGWRAVQTNVVLCCNY